MDGFRFENTTTLNLSEIQVHSIFSSSLGYISKETPPEKYFHVVEMMANELTKGVEMQHKNLGKVLVYALY